MINVVGVRFKKAGKIYYFGPGQLQVAVGQHVIVETARGVEFGEVVVGPKTVREEDVVQPLKEVQRLAEPQDYETVQDNQALAARAFATGTEKVAHHKLPMKLVDVEYTFDHGKLIFYFTADNRVDFRDLVKDLAAVFKTRIELRQIGVRDEAKMIGGIGPCGRSLCCATFLGDFDPVSIRMAKEQNLSLNPGKISGICGRLMCCLRYESEVYREQRREMPDRGSRVITPEHGEAQVKDVEPLKGTLKVKVDDSPKLVTVDADEVEEIQQTSKRRPKKPRPQGDRSERSPAADEQSKKPKKAKKEKGPDKGRDQSKDKRGGSGPNKDKKQRPAAETAGTEGQEKEQKPKRRRPKRRRPNKRSGDGDSNQGPSNSGGGDKA